MINIYVYLCEVKIGTAISINYCRLIKQAEMAVSTGNFPFSSRQKRFSITTTVLKVKQTKIVYVICSFVVMSSTVGIVKGQCHEIFDPYFLGPI